MLARNSGCDHTQFDLYLDNVRMSDAMLSAAAAMKPLSFLRGEVRRLFPRLKGGADADVALRVITAMLSRGRVGLCTDMSARVDQFHVLDLPGALLASLQDSSWQRSPGS